MKVIWKIKLQFRIDGLAEVIIPVGAKLLTIGRQGREYVLWVVVDDIGKKTEKVNIWMIGTGQGLDNDFLLTHEYITTFTDSMFVWHFFKEVG